MTQLRSIDISELDFDEIKTNLKAFLQNQSEFTDYDFEGSGLSVLLDVLAYNTHYNAYLANMLANEMFLDSAVKKSSAISIAKHLGYTPSSVRSARATVTVTVNGPSGSPSTLTLDAKTPFSTTLNGNTFTFYNLDAVTISQVNDEYVFEDLVLVEGSLGSFIYAVNQPGPDEKYELPDPNIDTSTLKVTVQTSSSNTAVEVYTLAVDTTNVTSTSKVYFLEQNPSGRYEVFFGDGIVGKKLTTGNLVKTEYLRSSGTLANTSNTITTSFTTSSIGGSSNIIISPSVNPSGATNGDSITDIKFKAPRVNAARNRAVTAADYEALITAGFNDAESISVWGGEDNIPPVYGKVFISLKPYEGFIISQNTKSVIADQIIRSKKVLAIQPEFVDPEYFYVNLTLNLTFDSTATTKTTSEIETIVRSTIANYFSTDLQKFNRDFNKSKLLKLILEADTSISSVIMLIKLQKRNTISLNALNTFTGDNVIKFENALQPGSLSSSRFFTLSGNTTTLAKIIDIPNTMPPSPTGTGTLQIRNASTNTAINTNIGNVNYGTGVVDITGFTPTSLPNNVSDFRVTAFIQESSHNLIVNRNQILVLDQTTRNAAAGREAGLTVNVSTIVE